jgi:SAM-dependent methyltransferase
VLDEKFDIVFTSYGVLKWLPDIDRWAQVVANFMRPGAVFFMVEFHPFLYVFDYDKAETIAHSYFYDSKPICYDEVGSYAEPGLPDEQKAYAWSHGVSNVITALLRAGLTLESFVEYPYSAIHCFPFVREEAPGRSVHATYPNMVPMMYSLRATKPR